MIASIGSSIAYELRSPMIRKSRSPLPVGSVASQSTRACGGRVRVPLQLPWPSPASGSPMSAHAEPFDFRWLTATVKRRAGGDLLEGLGEHRAAARVDEARVDGRGRGSRGRRRADVGRAVDQPDADGVGADHAGVDVVVGAGAEDRVQPGDHTVRRDRRADRRPVVFSISLRPMTSALSPTSAWSSLSRWRVNSCGSTESAPRHSRLRSRAALVVQWCRRSW